MIDHQVGPLAIRSDDSDREVVLVVRLSKTGHFECWFLLRAGKFIWNILELRLPEEPHLATAEVLHS